MCAIYLITNLGASSVFLSVLSNIFCIFDLLPHCRSCLRGDGKVKPTDRNACTFLVRECTYTGSSVAFKDELRRCRCSPP